MLPPTDTIKLQGMLAQNLLVGGNFGTLSYGRGACYSAALCTAQAPDMLIPPVGWIVAPAKLFIDPARLAMKSINYTRQSAMLCSMNSCSAPSGCKPRRSHDQRACPCHDWRGPKPDNPQMCQPTACHFNLTILVTYGSQ